MYVCTLCGVVSLFMVLSWTILFLFLCARSHSFFSSFLFECVDVLYIYIYGSASLFCQLISPICFVGFLFLFLVFVCLNSFSRLETFRILFYLFSYLSFLNSIDKWQKSNAHKRAWRAHAHTCTMDTHKRGFLILNAYRSNNVCIHGMCVCERSCVFKQFVIVIICCCCFLF